MQDAPYRGTKLGGAPGWVQYPEPPGPAWRFVGQLGYDHIFLTLPENPPAWVSAYTREDGTAGHVGQGPNFGDCGTAYLFLKPGTLDGAMLWQCG